MESEYARQTRWALPPDAVDPDRIPPGACFARQVVWLPCTECDLQVHAPATQWLVSGVACPECGRALAVAADAEHRTQRIRAVMDTEERFRQELAREETPCCD